MIIGKLATASDFDAYYFLKCDEKNILWSGHESAPDRTKLHEWFIKNIGKPDRLFFLFWNRLECDHVIGYLYMDIMGDDLDTIETGHGVHSNCAGKGYGTKIINYSLQHATDNMPEIRYFQGWIAMDNIGSIKNALKNGYYKSDETKLVEFGNGEVKIFEKYLIDIRRANNYEAI